MDSKWFAEIYSAGSGKPGKPTCFKDFAEALAFVKTFKKRPSSDVMRVHAPASATDQERDELRALGAELV
jgi:hypothetical protein